uniref:Uncharacterized protein n=1 Tax=Hyaloperonospora arabidopsidis (strain Emoy2) TaxID=559515 RepID=M4B3V2_HYAAE
MASPRNSIRRYGIFPHVVRHAGTTAGALQPFRYHPLLSGNLHIAINVISRDLQHPRRLFVTLENKLEAPAQRTLIPAELQQKSREVATHHIINRHTLRYDGRQFPPQFWNQHAS